MKTGPALNILYTNIGRGHPSYLDGIVDKLRSKFSDSIDLNILDVFAISRGVSLKLWKTVRWLYNAGSQGGPVGRLYETVRKGRSAEGHGLVEKQMARSIRHYLMSNRYPTLAAHPVLIPMISDLVPTYYQHGEIAVPDEAVVKGAEKVFVPLGEGQERFVRNGVPENRIMVSGLCIEDELVEKAEALFNDRISRLKSNQVLTGGFFSSGAEPRQHIRKIALAVESIIKSGHKAVVFCKENGRLEKALSRHLRIQMYRVTDSTKSLEDGIRSENAVGVIFRDRREENNLTAELFRYFDYFVAPSHERTNWAVGLGIPVFILHPTIGTFSPLNRDFLLREGVGIDISSDRTASEFASLLLSLKDDGTLGVMAQRGFNKNDVHGFERIAEALVDDLTGKQILC